MTTSPSNRGEERARMVSTILSLSSEVTKLRMGVSKAIALTYKTDSVFSAREQLESLLNDCNDESGHRRVSRESFIEELVAGSKRNEAE